MDVQMCPLELWKQGFPPLKPKGIGFKMSVELVKTWLCHVFPCVPRPLLTAEMRQHLASCLLVVLANLFWPCSVEVFQTVKSSLPLKITAQISVVADVQPSLWCQNVALKMLYADVQVEAVLQGYSETLTYQHFDLPYQLFFSKIMTYFWLGECTILMSARLVFWRFRGEEYWFCCRFHSMVSEVWSVRWSPLCVVQKELLSSHQKENIERLFARPKRWT